MSLTCFLKNGRILDGFTSDVGFGNFTRDPSELHFDPGVAGSQIAETHFKVEAREGHK